MFLECFRLVDDQLVDVRLALDDQLHMNARMMALGVVAFSIKAPVYLLKFVYIIFYKSLY